MIVYLRKKKKKIITTTLSWSDLHPNPKKKTNSHSCFNCGVCNDSKNNTSNVLCMKKVDFQKRTAQN